METAWLERDADTRMHERHGIETVNWAIKHVRSDANQHSEILITILWFTEGARKREPLLEPSDSLVVHAREQLTEKGEETPPVRVFAGRQAVLRELDGEMMGLKPLCAWEESPEYQNRMGVRCCYMGFRQAPEPKGVAVEFQRLYEAWETQWRAKEGWMRLVRELREEYGGEGMEPEDI